MSLSSTLGGDLAYQNIPFLSTPLLVQQRAIQRTADLAASVGGEVAGVSVLSASAVSQDVLRYCPQTTATIPCLEKRAYEACSVQQDAVACKATSMLLGNAVEQAAKAYLASTRRSLVDLYFLPVTRVSVVRNVHPDIAAVSIASKTTLMH